MNSAPESGLAKVTPPKELSDQDRETVFQHFFHRLAAYRNTSELYALAEYNLSQQTEHNKSRSRDVFCDALNRWAQDLLQNAWVACQEPGSSTSPTLDSLVDTSTGRLPKLPSPELLSRLLNTILFLNITASKRYSAHTRSFLFALSSIDEQAVVSTLKNPEKALQEAQKHTQEAREQHAERGRALRMAGIGLSAVAGGVLVGITGGLAAPLVGAGVTTILGWLGVGGTAAGLLASGLASSSVVCGALFGAYGARSTANMVGRHIREVRDLALVPVRTRKDQETLGVRLCVSGWLSNPSDVTAPWTIFDGDDVFALQWEVEALQAMSGALITLIKSQAMKYVKAEIIKRTILASLLSALSPVAWLKIGKIIDNPWMNARALAIKTGAVLGTLLASRVFGNRPITLTGYSLGSLVVLEALEHLAKLRPSETIGLVQDVFLFGTPAPNDPATWASIRRLVCGRLVNGYSRGDYVLAVLSRASDASWGVAGLQPVDVKGVENVECEGVDGHLQWRGMIGKCLRDCHAPGIVNEEVDAQLQNVANAIQKDVDMSGQEVENAIKAGPGDSEGA
ncbi:DUF726-domain-containing protein [Leucogyrophana mollusca]|uniref:DUF726-domain-containing protein n=1 Tax=Leucogyrophana mollusca TaxID=85980 RepID=A0ACB8BWX0_9AGAM|nr:DUF726-domain-containing protein [Leucogyrophana mollusca]